MLLNLNNRWNLNFEFVFIFLFETFLRSIHRNINWLSFIKLNTRDYTH